METWPLLHVCTYNITFNNTYFLQMNNVLMVYINNLKSNSVNSKMFNFQTHVTIYMTYQDEK